ncbi:diaminopimelate epimerase [Lacinutrix sp. Bg11-31]|uniref:diaminopimelate epimerase n=1 Tax=Lacinutrix sp. Bg11-31 TaxID=2057808 RepID=UPI000C3198A7|nr:diaminopimelate epimerase [Lacinutrix sp. Bg11-31]AUC81941.1 diaminopimelate epimerase [Lacinutrix sp. Bg11-31]
MTHTFYKYQGTGNDFVFVDNREELFNKDNTKLIAHLCDRRFGVGADGLILLENDSSSDFKMVYFNADGNESTMCGNGGRCIVAFAEMLNIFNKETTFNAIDGLHEATIENGFVKLKMQDVDTIEVFDTHAFLNTGSPHHVALVENIKQFDVKNEGSKIRYGSPYNQEGTNVNFVEQINTETFAVRTYERGVEDETLSCGTGVTAVALAMHNTGKTNTQEVALNVEGGKLKVSFEKTVNGYKNIWLQGPATLVFKGEMEW